MKIEFANREEAKLWIIRNQLDRRNLPDFVRFELMDKASELLKEKGKETQGTRTDLKRETNNFLSIVDKSSGSKPHNTRKEIASSLGWSTGKTAMAQKVQKEAPLLSSLSHECPFCPPLFP